jgi:predicted NAD/FAD-binding protein
MTRVAVIGGGISGLAAAYYLSRKHTVWLFEKEMRIGGHTNTVTVDTPRGALPLDTGFLVFNDRTYPNLVRLFAELGVEGQPSDMSFSVACRKSGFEYSSRGLRGFFAQRGNAVRGRHYRLLAEILRFNRTARRLLDAPDADRWALGDYLDSHNFRGDFLHRYLFPMASAVWSAPRAAIRAFPALTLIRFFDNHGMLGVSTHPKWKVVRGGSRVYLHPIARPFVERISSGSRIVSVHRDRTGVTVAFAGRPQMRFDHVVFACHGDEVLPLLADPTEREREVFDVFQTSRNEVCLHTDGSLLPVRHGARASWNYRLGDGDGDGGAATVTYHLNRLQSLDAAEDYCVTLNGNGSLNPERVLRRMIYRHPLYTREAIRAQSRWSEVSGVDRTHYCGAYWFYGFHEDGLNSALRVARTLGVNA